MRQRQDEDSQVASSIQSKNSQKLVLNRFLYDFRDVSQHHEIEAGSTIDFTKMENFCRDLGFYDDRQSSKVLLCEIWNHLQVEEKEEVDLNTTTGTI